MATRAGPPGKPSSEAPAPLGSPGATVRATWRALRARRVPVYVRRRDHLGTAKRPHRVISTLPQPRQRAAVVDSVVGLTRPVSMHVWSQGLVGLEGGHQHGMVAYLLNAGIHAFYGSRLAGLVRGCSASGWGSPVRAARAVATSWRSARM